MKINNSTKWAEFAPFATPTRLAQLREKITGCANFDFWSLTIGEFSPMLDGDFPDKIKEILEDKKTTVFKAVELINAVDKFNKEFAEIMQSMEIELESDEQKAVSMMPTLKPIENILNFCLDNFGTDPKTGRFNEEITLIEFLIRKRYVHANSVYQRALNKIQTAKLKQR